MNIKGLDYNTQRERLILPEYGREVQQMVDHCVALPNRAERQRCANTIIAVMERMIPRTGDAESFRRKLWDHLALMSQFKLDIDYPFDINEARSMLEKPKPIPYPMRRIPVRHYGGLMFEVFDMLKTMPQGPERTELIRLVANQMKRDLVQWRQRKGSVRLGWIYSRKRTARPRQLQVRTHTKPYARAQAAPPQINIHTYSHSL